MNQFKNQKLKERAAKHRAFAEAERLKRNAQQYCKICRKIYNAQNDRELIKHYHLDDTFYLDDCGYLHLMNDMTIFN